MYIGWTQKNKRNEPPSDPKVASKDPELVKKELIQRTGVTPEKWRGDPDDHGEYSQFTSPILRIKAVPVVENELNGNVGLEHATLHFDGASRGNPGDAAFGFVLDIADGDTIERSNYLGELTNNEAEYHALERGLREASQRQLTSLTIYGDSELIIKQVRGEYDCNANNLQTLLDSVQSYLSEFDDVGIQHLPRSKNHLADDLANKALDALADD